MGEQASRGGEEHVDEGKKNLAGCVASRGGSLGSGNPRRHR